METISFLDLPRKCIEWITMVFLLITMLLDIGTPTATNGLELTNEKSSCSRMPCMPVRE